MHRDHLGSVDVITSSSGTLINSLSHDPFGGRRDADWSADISTTDMATFVSRLNGRKALTPSLLLRALARGQVTFVEHGLAELSQTPHSRTWLMVHDAGPLGLKAIYDRAGLPPRLFQAFRSGIDTWRALQAEGADFSTETFRQRMLERFLTQRPNVPREDLAYLMERLDRSPLPEDMEKAANAA